MRSMPLGVLCCLVVIGLTTATGLRAEAVKVTPGLTVFADEQASSSNDSRPKLLRGNATRRGTVDARFGPNYEPARFQLGAGDKLWLADPASGRVIVCDERRTSRVGSRFIGCLEDQLPYDIYE